eukprot:CAMPEP_0116854534 /NCGR_PEP_ID=MMETSP0418-20121206/18672_1 /TAXON_ID=1158023 /ORGANISM="Astrosyne radiata, Strain 13vi08-1A" /LENGTH=91 /DNA_ID=CAMNT_0004487359 /DNA_START=24 /DNA_END=296 /DNA_ORIENTATION=+
MTRTRRKVSMCTSFLLGAGREDGVESEVSDFKGFSRLHVPDLVETSSRAVWTDVFRPSPTGEVFTFDTIRFPSPDNPNQTTPDTTTPRNNN